MKKLSKKRLEALISKTYSKAAEGKSIDIMDIGKIFKAGEDAYAKEGTEAAVEAAVKEAAAKYCIPADNTNALEAMYS